MTRALIIFAILVITSIFLADRDAHALCQATALSVPQGENTTMQADSCDLDGNKRTSSGTLSAGEDLTATGGGSASGVTVTESRYLTAGPYTADQQIKAAAGYVSHLSCQGSDNAAVAGTIIVYDSLTETSTAAFTFTVAALDYHVPFVLLVQRAFTTGIYLGYTTTTDVACTVHYR